MARGGRQGWLVKNRGDGVVGVCDSKTNKLGEKYPEERGEVIIGRDLGRQ